MTETIRMTTAQAIVRFLDNQYISMDGVETKFVEGFFTIFGHLQACSKLMAFMFSTTAGQVPPNF